MRIYSLLSRNFIFYFLYLLFLRLCTKFFLQTNEEFGSCAKFLARRIADDPSRVCMERRRCRKNEMNVLGCAETSDPFVQHYIHERDVLHFDARVTLYERPEAHESTSGWLRSGSAARSCGIYGCVPGDEWKDAGFAK